MDVFRKRGSSQVQGPPEHHPRGRAACSRARAIIRAAVARVAAAMQSPRAADPPGVTLVVSTFERPACIADFIASACASFAHLDILVCDASAEPLFDEGSLPGGHVRWLALPKARGHTVGAARNHALEHVETPLFFLCDDDHVLGWHTQIERAEKLLHAHDLDIVGGCQGRHDYGTAVFVRHAGRLEQRFYWHHGRIAAGLVRCDRVSNTFLARTCAVRAVGWEERVYGDEHAEFFWRAKLAGLRVAQMADSYVHHDRRSETPSSLMRHLLRPLLAHADRDYLRLRQGGNVGVASAAYDAFVLRKNSLSAIVSRARRCDKRAFFALMAQP